MKGHQDISIKFLALKCWFYALALSLSVSNWLFWFTRWPIERLWTWKVGQDGPKTAPQISGSRFSTAGGFPCGHRRRDISLGNLKHPNTDGEISQSYICQISPNSVSVPAGCLDTTYLMHHLCHFFFPSVNIRLLGIFGDNWQHIIRNAKSNTAWSCYTWYKRRFYSNFSRFMLIFTRTLGFLCIFVPTSVYASFVLIFLRQKVCSC